MSKFTEIGVRVVDSKRELPKNPPNQIVAAPVLRSNDEAPIQCEILRNYNVRLQIKLVCNQILQNLNTQNQNRYRKPTTTVSNCSSNRIQIQIQKTNYFFTELRNNCSDKSLISAELKNHQHRLFGEKKKKRNKFFLNRRCLKGKGYFR